MDLARHHARARERGVNPLVYWIVRAILQPAFHIYFRLSRVGREHVPADGPVIFAANHRSFLDPFVIGTLARRPIYYVAKEELFRNSFVAWLLNSLGAFPVRRGQADGEMLETARAILDRGDCVVIFPEGSRIRPGSLASPKRGVGRLALESGAPVVPVAVIGTERVRKGWRFRPHKVRIRAGRALTFPQVDIPSPALAAAVTDRIWPCVMLQWEWLGGLAPLRRATVIGAGAWGTGMAVLLARAGLDVDLVCRRGAHAEALAASRTNKAYLPGVELPAGVRPVRAADAALSGRDLVCFAVPARDLPAAVAEHAGAVPERAGVLVLAKGLVPPLGTRPAAYVAERTSGRAIATLGGPAHAGDALEHGASLVAASLDAGFSRQLAATLRDAGIDVQTTGDVTGAELAACAKNAAALAAAAAQPAGPNAAGAVAGKVFEEVGAFASDQGARPETMAGLAGAGDLVATVIAQEGRNRRAGELLASGLTAGEIEPALGHAAEGVDTIPLLAAAMREAGIAAPTVDRLEALVEGRIAAADWSTSITEPAHHRKARAA